MFIEIADASVLGRVFIGIFFVFFGMWNSYHWRPTLEAMRQKHIPIASVVLWFGIILETLCGLMLIVGYHTPIAALLLIPFTLVSIVMFHHFWTFSGEIRRLNMLCFITNLTATMGALLILLGAHATH